MQGNFWASLDRMRCNYAYICIIYTLCIQYYIVLITQYTSRSAYLSHSFHMVTWSHWVVYTCKKHQKPNAFSFGVWWKGMAESSSTWMAFESFFKGNIWDSHTRRWIYQDLFLPVSKWGFQISVKSINMLSINFCSEDWRSPFCWTCSDVFDKFRPSR